jgi:hypothetical protein
MVKLQDRVDQAGGIVGTCHNALMTTLEVMLPVEGMTPGRVKILERDKIKG